PEPAPVHGAVAAQSEHHRTLLAVGAPRAVKVVGPSFRAYGLLAPSARDGTSTRGAQRAESSIMAQRRGT
ncbi:MAG: hypothetical protein WCD76_03890, partial [Pyrinomonadaceae bacterium]